MSHQMFISMDGHNAIFVGSVLLRCLDPAIIAKNWEALLVAVNISGFFLSGIAYLKAHVSPTSEGDRKFSGKLDWTYSWILWRKDSK